MPPSNPGSLWEFLVASPHLSECSLRSSTLRVNLGDLASCSSLRSPLEELRGRSVLVAIRDQLAAALVLIELDGLARRLVLCPSDLAREHLPYVAANAEVDALVSDGDATESDVPTVPSYLAYAASLTRADYNRRASHRTEWILLTSGTTGAPKMVLHTLSSLAGPVGVSQQTVGPLIWSTFYDIRRYGGLQILLRALLDGRSMVLSDPQESPGDFLSRAGVEGVTHISGTPSHWRRALMSPWARKFAPRYVRLSGEIVDQGILDRLRDLFPEATIVHAFASTEAGVAFEVRDGVAGFSASLIEKRDSEVEMKIEEGSLRIRSARTALCYLGSSAAALADRDGFVDTRDMVEARGDRCYFVGRMDGVINVGGLKVHPEEVEAVLNRHPSVLMSLAKARRNPLTGSVVTADVVLKSCADCGDGDPRGEGLKADILETCRCVLAPYKVPVAIHFVPSLNVGASGKLARL